ncbi:MAG: lamin tail domain-containing protein [Phaeodactylibacter sp.]|uniref:lamin tail domain-containing protein n=1 Tax=Phaeodactylibacter sp. TaxID=1940289 RepID=UPI0032F010A7
MKALYYLSLLLTLFALPLQAQLQDDFSDGDFSSNPEWLGDADRFTVTAGELQLLDTDPGSNNESALYVAAPTSADAATVWTFFVRTEFSPSSSNYARIYLSASSPDLKSALNGYYVRIGGISGSDDAVELYRQDGATSTLLISGAAGSVGNDPALARVRVARSVEGEWTLETDYSGGSDFTLEGTATDLTYPTGSFFGWVCTYTSTRAELFFLDEVLVDPLFADTSPPTLLNVTPNTAFQIEARFSEPLDAQIANEAANFSISNGIGTPASAELQADPTRVLLSLGTALQNTASYTLTANNIQDEAGNTAGSLQSDFTYFDIQPALPGDLIITELMPDPTPSVALPEAEYLELYNASDKVIDLSTLQIASGSTPEPLSAAFLLPGQYVVVCDAAFVPAFAEIGPAVGVSDFPALSNGGDVATVLDQDGNSLFEITYTDAWYQDNARADGGYSLELIRLEGPYNCPGNWRASQSTTGGTPGLENSLLGATLDTTPPSVIKVVPESSMEIRIEFSEIMDAATVSNPGAYTLSPDITVLDVLLQPGGQTALLVLNDELSADLAYTLSLAATITDCIGNALPEQSFAIGLPQIAEPQDIIINEILFNPESGGSDFIELYNQSNKIIDLLGLQLLNRLKMSGAIQSSVDDNLLIFPGDYLVFTEDPADILARYTVPAPNRLLENDLPALDNDEGNLTLVLNGITLDAFDYSEDQHYPLLDDENGVSLERISPMAGTQDAGNWHSAASTAGFATPTGPNSQFFEREGVFDEIISIPRARFSPDEDGFEDVLLIDYTTDQPGYTANVWIFDAQGREILRLVNNETLQTTGSLKWDGIAADGSPARIGIYILYFELFRPDGAVEKDKRAVVLAGQLD